MYNIAVIGCGAIGLTTAVALQKEFGSKANIKIYTKDVSPNTTGDISAGLWYPYLVGKTPEQNISKWAKDTENYIARLWKKGKASVAGISLVPILAFSDDPDLQPPEWTKASFGFHKFSDDEINKFNKDYNRKHSAGFSLVSFTFEPSKFLPFLQQKFLKNGGTIVMKEVKKIDELADNDIIVNCTGLGARELVQDQQLMAIRGQVARVRAPWVYHTILEDTDDGNYIIPNMESVILGGTHQEHDYDTVVRESDKNKIFNGCLDIMPSLKNASVVQHKVGLRPGRNAVKIEVENKKVCGKDLIILHNYGHGGSGVTMSYGSALEATKLLKQELRIKKSKL